MTEKASTTTFIHPKGKELDARITTLYDKGAIQVTNFAVSDDSEFQGRVRGQIENTLQRAWNDREALEEDWEIFKALFDLVNLDTSIRSNANVHVPEVVKAVNIRVRELMIAVFSRDSWARAIGLNRASQEKARHVTELQLNQLRDEKFPVKFKQWVKTLVMYGTSCALQDWGHLPKRVNAATVTIVDIDEHNKQVTINAPSDEDRNKNISQPIFMPFPIWDWVADPNCFDVQRGTFVGHRAILTRNQVQALADAGVYKNIKQLEARPIPPFRRSRDLVARHLIDQIQDVQTAQATDEFEIWEVWCPFKLPNTDKERECVLTIERNSMTILRVSENPFWHGMRPYMAAQFEQDEDGALYGRGIIEPIASLQMELDDTRNLSLIAKDLLVNPMFEADISVDLAGERLIASPGRILPAGLKPVQMNDGTYIAFRHEQTIKADIREVVSTPQALSGGSQSGDETATENTNRIQEAKSDVVEIAKDIGDLCLLPMLNMRHGLNAQFMREERTFRTIGAPARRGEPLFTIIDPTDLIGQFHYEWRGLRDFAVKGKRTSTMKIIMDSFARFPDLKMDSNAVARAMVQEIFDEEDANAFFPDLQEDSKLAPTFEHELAMQGQELLVHPLDDHALHARAHKQFLQNPPKGMSLLKQLALDAHFINHMAELQKQMEAQRKEQQRLLQEQQAINAQQGGPVQQRQPGRNGQQGGSAPRQVIPNPSAPQAPEAQLAQISGAGPDGAV